MWLMDDTAGNNGCPGEGWSIITSSGANSQLASVLAGFVFTGIVLLVDRRGSRRNTQALGLFAATLVVLGFCSYLFSLVTGGSSDTYCKRVWAEGMTASGGLALGGFALITSVCWLLAAHVERMGESAHADGLALDRLATVMIIGVAAGIMLLLGMTASDYLDVATNRAAPWYLAPGLPLLVIALTAAAGFPRVRLGTGRRSSASILNFALYGTLLYGIAAPVCAGLFIGLPDSNWLDERPSPLPIIAGCLTIGLLLPAVLLVAIVHATPRIVSRAPVTTQPPAEQESLQ